MLQELRPQTTDNDAQKQRGQKFGDEKKEYGVSILTVLKRLFFHLIVEGDTWLWLNLLSLKIEVQFLMYSTKILY